MRRSLGGRLKLSQKRVEEKTCSSCHGVLVDEEAPCPHCGVTANSQRFEDADELVMGSNTVAFSSGGGEWVDLAVLFCFFHIVAIHDKVSINYYFIIFHTSISTIYQYYLFHLYI